MKKSRKIEKLKKKEEEEKLLEQLEEEKKNRLEKYTNLPGMITNLQDERLRLQNLDFTFFLKSLETSLFIYQSANEVDEVIQKECIEEWQKQEVNNFLLLPLTLTQQKQLVSVMMKCLDIQDAVKYIWTPFFAKMYLFTPDIPKASTYKQVSSGELDNPQDPIGVSTFTSLLYLFMDTYVQIAIEKQNLKWDVGAMYEIIGLLNRFTLVMMFTKLSIKHSLASSDDARYYNEFVDCFSGYVLAHTNFYAQTLEDNFQLPESCVGAELAYKKYKDYMDEQNTKVPISFTFKGETRQFKVMSLGTNSREYQRMKEVKGHKRPFKTPFE
jgi:hypothetical protein